MADRRRRKYHTNYIDALSQRAIVLENFISSYTSDKSLLDALNRRLSIVETSNIDSLLSRLNLSNPTDNITNVHEQNDDAEFPLTASSRPLALKDDELEISDPEFEAHILHLFLTNFAVQSPAVSRIARKLPPYNRTRPGSSLKFLHSVILALGTFYYRSMEHQESIRTHLVDYAKSKLMEVIDTQIDIYLLLGLSLLSSLETIQNNLSQAYLFNSLACALTQHMGLHIVGDGGPLNNTIDDTASIAAKKKANLNHAVFWTVIIQDRLITNFIQVPSVIHYKRILTPFYQVSSKPEKPGHMDELLFSYLTRLFYIYDRFADQLQTVNRDVGDTEDSLRLLEMGVKTLEELRRSVPLGLLKDAFDIKKIETGEAPQIIEDTKSGLNRMHVLTFLICHKLSLLKLNQICVAKFPSSVPIKKQILEKTIEAAELFKRMANADILDRSKSPDGENETGFLGKLPFFFVNFVNSIGFNIIVVLSTLLKTPDSNSDTGTNSSDDSELTVRLLSYLPVIHSLLKRFSLWYKAGRDALNAMEQLSVKTGVPIKEADIKLLLQELELGHDLDIQTPQEDTSSSYQPTSREYTDISESVYTPQTDSDVSQNPTDPSTVSAFNFGYPTYSDSPNLNFETITKSPLQNDSTQYDQDQELPDSNNEFNWGDNNGSEQTSTTYDNTGLYDEEKRGSIAFPQINTVLSSDILTKEAMANKSHENSLSASEHPRSFDLGKMINPNSKGVPLSFSQHSSIIGETAGQSLAKTIDQINESIDLHLGNLDTNTIPKVNLDTNYDFNRTVNQQETPFKDTVPLPQNLHQFQQQFYPQQYQQQQYNQEQYIQQQQQPQFFQDFAPGTTTQGEINGPSYPVNPQGSDILNTGYVNDSSQLPIEIPNYNDEMFDNLELSEVNFLKFVRGEKTVN